MSTSGGRRAGAEDESIALVTLTLPLVVQATDKTSERFYALAHWALSRVPTIGEEVIALGERQMVDRVVWAKDFVNVRLEERPISQLELDKFEAEGWSIHSSEHELPDWLG